MARTTAHIWADRPAMPPTSLTPAIPSFNGLISHADSARAIRIETLAYGLDIITGSTEQSRNRTSFYPLAVNDSAFVLGIVHVSRQEGGDFYNWLQHWMISAANGVGVVTPYLRVQLPRRKFDRYGVCSGTLDYTEVAGQANPKTGEGVYRTQLTFSSAMNPTRQGTSYVKFSKDQTTLPFYPSGKQVSGAESLDGTIFDPNPQSMDASPTRPPLTGKKSTSLPIWTAVTGGSS